MRQTAMSQLWHCICIMIKHTPRGKVAFMRPYANTIVGPSASRTETSPTEVVEVSLLLSRHQISQLAQQAQRCGLTSAQFLRQYISTLCQSCVEPA